MKLSRLFGLTEAGVPNKATGKPKKRYAFGKSVGSITNPELGGKFWTGDDDDDEDEDDLGPDIDYDDPSPPERDVRPAKQFKEPEPKKDDDDDRPFASHSAKPSPALQGGKTAGSVKADVATLGALQKALEHVRTGDDDLQDWIDDTIREISRAISKGGDLTLPKFEATPSLDAFDDDGGSEDEDY